MSLKDISLPPIIDTASADPMSDFFIPALSTAIQYDRGVGYFSSGWLRLASQGLVQFANNGGRARWVTSPILAPDDWKALELGEKAKTDLLLHQSLQKSILDLQTTLERDTLSTLAWMVADGILTFKLALPIGKLRGGDFHDKFGSFTDASGDKVAFMGSHNESIKGTINSESFSIFFSWHEALIPYIKDIQQRFERLWADQEPNVRVYELPEAAKAQILQLRTEERPYHKPDWVQSSYLQESTGSYIHSYPHIPESIQLRDYQEQAIDNWFAHQYQGLLEMATGTGKTITALAASVQLYQREQRLAVIVTVPYQHLVDQWNEEAKAFGYKPILAYQSKHRWLDQFNEAIVEYNGRYRSVISVITTHITFSSADFQASLKRLNGPTLLIADEAHHLGAEQRRRNYPHQIPYRLALSATPDRWFDDVGTAVLRAYFGETVFTFSLEEAIGVSLTPYYYYPHLVPLTDDEMVEYEQLSIKIARLINHDDEEKQETLKMLLIRRANLLNLATNKLDKLSMLIDQEARIEHTLFYCAPNQIDKVLQLAGWDKGILLDRFTAQENTKKRQQLLSHFADGTLQALAAMKCLDEGVDVPSTRTAYFLASSSNPREFVQRRGRILRKAEGKEHSVIHDLIAVPPITIDTHSLSFKAERSIMKRELGRFKEFANPAKNKHQAMDIIWDMASHYGLMDF